jgi:carboxymethylenebutenolidase
MGCRLGWRIAAAHPDRVAALGCFHGGGLVTDAPTSPHLSAGDLKAELYFGHADQDRSMTAEQIAILERALDDAGARYRSELYAGAAHGYTMGDTPRIRRGRVRTPLRGAVRVARPHVRIH